MSRDAKTDTELLIEAIDRLTDAVNTIGSAIVESIDAMADAMCEGDDESPWSSDDDEDDSL